MFVFNVIILVVPKVCGIAIYSPRLDGCHNSTQGIQFCTEIVKQFAFHHFDAMMPDDTTKLDPRSGSMESQIDKHIMELCFAAERGDVQLIKRLMMHDIDSTRANYDERTALHVAASEGRIDAVRELLTAYDSIDELTKDRYGRTALDDAKHFSHDEVVRAIELWFSQKHEASPQRPSETSGVRFQQFESYSPSNPALLLGTDDESSDGDVRNFVKLRTD